MSKILDFFKHRRIGWYVLFVAVVVAIVSFLFYVIDAPSNKLNSGNSAIDVTYIILVVCGILSSAAALVLKKKEFDILSPLGAGLLGSAFVLMIVEMLPTMSDSWNNVNFIGGDLGSYMAYTITIGIPAILSIVSVFMGIKTYED